MIYKANEGSKSKFKLSAFLLICNVADNLHDFYALMIAIYRFYLHTMNSERLGSIERSS